MNYDYLVIGTELKLIYLIHKIIEKNLSVLWLTDDLTLKTSNSVHNLFIDLVTLKKFMNKEELFLIENQIFIGMDRKIYPLEKMKAVFEKINHVSFLKNYLFFQSDTYFSNYHLTNLTFKENPLLTRMTKEDFQKSNLKSQKQIEFKNFIQNKNNSIDFYGIIELNFNAKNLNLGKYLILSSFQYKSLIKNQKSVFDPKLLNSLEMATELIFGYVFENKNNDKQALFQLFISDEETKNPLMIEQKIKMLLKTLKSYFKEENIDLKSSSIRIIKDFLVESQKNNEDELNNFSDSLKVTQFQQASEILFNQIENFDITQ